MASSLRFPTSGKLELIDVAQKLGTNTAIGSIRFPLGKNFPFVFPDDVYGFVYFGFGFVTSIYNSSEQLNIQISFRSINAWTLSSNQPWLSLDTTSGAGSVNSQTVTFDLTENLSAADRTAEITLTDTVTLDSVFVSILQLDAGGSIVNVSPDELFFSFEVDSQTISITSNTDWEITDNVTWLSYSQTAGTGTTDVTVTTLFNVSPDQRVGQITITSVDQTISDTISVTQFGNPDPPLP